jgi:hypothetical protein
MFKLSSFSRILDCSVGQAAAMEFRCGRFLCRLDLLVVGYSIDEESLSAIGVHELGAWIVGSKDKRLSFPWSIGFFGAQFNCNDH